MKLTQKEIKVLAMLLENGRMRDAEIGRELSISTTAARKIRRGLEEKGVIRGYSTLTTYNQLGANIFALIHLTPINKRFSNLEERENIEEAIKNMPNLLSGCRISQGNPTHIIFVGFRDFEEMNGFLQQMRVTPPLSEMDITKIYTFSQNDIFRKHKLSFMDLLGRISHKSSPKILQRI